MTKDDILCSVFEPMSTDDKIFRSDIQLAITLNPDLKKVERCMDEWANIKSKEVAIGFAEYLFNNWRATEDSGNAENLFNNYIGHLKQQQL